MHINILSNHDLGVRFEKENINTFDDKSELLLTIFSSLAQEESRNISENVKWGRQKLVQRGMMKISGHRFYGYDSDKNGNWIISKRQT
ncbi:MAG: recombinase family protein [Clostridiales bacterium]|nr:recombinase family protein [Clostridiales bacterium]MCF8023615.1 recombinase family protein [Clostridiales bacterium]